MSLLDVDYQSMVANSFANAADALREDLRFTVGQYALPGAIFKPRLSIDGNQWCALYGENLQDGVCGFGDSPALAIADFNKQWAEPLPKGVQS